jgi:hypothetical protein
MLSHGGAVAVAPPAPPPLPPPVLPPDVPPEPPKDTVLPPCPPVPKLLPAFFELHAANGKKTAAAAPQ